MKISREYSPLTKRAADDWKRVYIPLSAGKPGLTRSGHRQSGSPGCSTGYAICAARLLLSYPLACHLQAALAVWDYCEASASFIFGDSLGDDTADTILSHLNSVGKSGASRSEIRAPVQRKKSSSEIAAGPPMPRARTGAAWLVRGRSGSRAAQSQ